MCVCVCVCVCVYIYIYIYIYIYQVNPTRRRLLSPQQRRRAPARTQEKTCSSYCRFRRKLSGTTGHRLLGMQRPQILWVTAWVWFSLTTECVVVPLAGREDQ